MPYLDTGQFNNFLPAEIRRHEDAQLLVREAERDVVRYYTSPLTVVGFRVPVSDSHGVFLAHWRPDFNGVPENDEEARFVDQFREAVAAVVKHRFGLLDVHPNVEGWTLGLRGENYKEGADPLMPPNFKRFLQEYDTRDYSGVRL